RPRLDAGPDAEHVLVAGVAYEEQRTGAVLRVTRQIGFDPYGNRVAEPGPALKLETTLLADDRARAVATDDIAGAHFEFAAVEPLANPGRGVFRSLTDRHHLVIEADVGPE